MSLPEAMIRSDAPFAASAMATAREEPSRKEQWDQIFCGGHQVLIRPIHKMDVAAELRFIERLSPRSRRFHFTGEMRSRSRALLKLCDDAGPSSDVALIALLVGGIKEREIGVAHLSARSNSRTCEFAVTVADEWRLRGLVTLLMQRLIDSALARGLESVYSIDAADNELMREFAEHLGFRRRPYPNDATQVLHSLDFRVNGVAAI